MNKIQFREIAKLSPAMQFLSHVWKHSQEVTSHSWLKLNHAMHETLMLAVTSGMRFDTDDFGEMARLFNLGYWCGDLEYCYQRAVIYRNSSAYQAYEKHRNRKPFIMAGASWSGHTGDGPAGEGLARLFVGAKFTWHGEKVTVTSFNDTKGSFTACSYKCEEPKEQCDKCGNTTTWPCEKLKSRYTITHNDIRKAKAATKQTTP
jgi:hypothetical protein